MRAVLVLVVVLSAAAPAAAQETPRFDFSGGYSFVRHDEPGDPDIVIPDFNENFHGWVVSGAGYVNRWLAIVGELGRNSKSLTPEPDIDLNFSLTSFLGGARFYAPTGTRVSLFGQVLAGGLRGAVSIDAPGFDESESTTEFALQPGAGVDILFNRSFGIRIGGDYRRVFVSDEGTDNFNQFRFQVTVVVRGS